ncbi:hypothetical protein [Citrobacter koseri]|uniref:hypothetical protein n=1 Tax=Citrobacter koseri TaxID=545 RepID=UPI0019045BEC|nr:hypothetical protein [Citrobacter koseri]EKW1004422.1 hypothetical protein [Citrobacter koseri]ELG4624020.1 hypothetical protein [Citrobacter koseri]EMD6815664.1 hypothetical protein [Citrobacter koseri]MBJ9011660.1 hypothetical protein [Citrobacter koseri]
MSFTRELYKLGFEISPVILCDGVAQSIPGGMLPIVALTQSASYVSGLLGGAIELTDLDKYFCHWRAAPGATMIDYDIGRYPFANQAVAANALLSQPLRIPLLMDAPVNENTGAMTKLVTLSALQAVLQAHANLGGTFIVATPGIIYSNCILRTVRDVTGSNDTLPQRQWLWDFEQPLISETGADQAINSYLTKIDNGDKATESAWTSTVSAIGNTSLGSSVSGAVIGLIGKLSGAFNL